jgi:hypothetical protein
VSAIVDGETEVDRLSAWGATCARSPRELVLTTGDAGGVEIAVNGVAARRLGKDGEAVSKRLTPANFAEFLPPR